MTASGKLRQRQLMAGCRRTPSRTHWPLLLQSCPSGEDSTAGNPAAASALLAVASNGRLQKPPPSALGRLPWSSPPRCVAAYERERPARRARVEGRRQRPRQGAGQAAHHPLPEALAAEAG